MEVEILARIQFALTAGFHYIYPPMSIGLGLIMVIMEGMYLKTKNPIYETMAKYWTKIFGLTFAVGVATGIVMEFEFGTNWATYSRYVGDIFGSPLAAEALFAFFLESTFLGILIFGWNRVKPRTHFIATICVAFGAMLSGLWIIIANSWMQTPAGFHIVETNGFLRAEITDFWAAAFNPSTIDRYTHVISAAWLTGAFFVSSIAAYYLLKKQHLDFAKKSLKIALILAFVASVVQLGTGHQSAVGVAKNQPAKLAAFEGHYKTQPGDLYLFGWVNEETNEVTGLKIPGFLSFLVYFDASKPVTGLDDIPPVEREGGMPTVEKPIPPVNFTFQVYHLMVALGMLMLSVSFIAMIQLMRKKLYESKLLLKILVPLFLAPHFSNMFGWMAAEVGRQPWAVQNILLTNEAVSKSVSAGEIWFSLILFTLIYILLFVLFVYLLLKKIKHGPEAVPESV